MSYLSLSTPEQEIPYNRTNHLNISQSISRQAIVGKVPFDTIMSVVGISAFVLITSQLLGNVAVVQLAKPNVEMLADKEKGNQK